jgi:hypothetical protein
VVVVGMKIDRITSVVEEAFLMDTAGRHAEFEDSFLGGIHETRWPTQVNLASRDVGDETLDGVS